ncbi:MAG: aminotransferase class I/II-fold pyridoxal phosphate-dependent enzyme [Bacteroides sp.]|nr:aminotransferase class I/II-fold pyridoxal phosphate-dependent enzyme [Bacteroides sp.]
MTGRELHYLQNALADDWATPLGPDCDAFESELKHFLKTDHPVAALQSGTAAVHLALLSLGVGPGDEVIVQSFTFAASANPVKYVGATPVFVDSESDTWNISPVLLERAIADRIEKTGRPPKAIIPVALYGMPYKIREILEVADKYGIPVIEDAAEGFGSCYDRQMLGTFGRFGVLSFNGNKMITTGGGGALVCPDEDTRRRVMWYATQAREAYPYYQHEEIGYNYRMSNLCACVGRAQMEIIDRRINHHRWVQQRYAELLADIPGLTLHQNPSPEFDSNFWLCTITLDSSIHIRNENEAYRNTVKQPVGGAASTTREARSAETDCQPARNVEALRLALDEAAIESRPLWKPMHRQPVYADAPAYIDGTSERLFRQGLCLPAGPYVGEPELLRISDAIHAACE